MTDVTQPVLDIERVLFLDARNKKFVEKTSRITARVQDARQLLWQIGIILTFVGAVLFLAVSNHLVDGGLKESGRVTKGVILAKSQSQRICRVTYRFSGPAVYERQADIAYAMCPTLSEGQAVEVLYDPQQPLYSNLKVSLEKPKYPVWPASLGFVVVAGIFYAQFLKVRREHRFCAEGQVICGALVSNDVSDEQLEMQYRFRAPAGFIIGASAEGRVQRSTWTNDWQFFPDKPNQVAVLFLSETEFYLL